MDLRRSCLEAAIDRSQPAAQHVTYARAPPHRKQGGRAYQRQARPSYWVDGEHAKSAAPVSTVSPPIDLELRRCGPQRRPLPTQPLRTWIFARRKRPGGSGSAPCAMGEASGVRKRRQRGATNHFRARGSGHRRHSGRTIRQFRPGCNQCRRALRRCAGPARAPVCGSPSDRRWT